MILTGLWCEYYLT